MWLSDNERLLADYGVPFVTAWKITHNYRVWFGNKHPAMAAITPGWVGKTLSLAFLENVLFLLGDIES